MKINLLVFLNLLLISFCLIFTVNAKTTEIVKVEDDDLSVTVVFDGTGTAQDPYIIDSEEAFIKFVGSGLAFTDMYFLQTSDIDASVLSYVSERVPFSGIYNGGNHSIIGLGFPLFTSTDGAIIENLTIKDVNIANGSECFGAFVGTAQGKTVINNCYVSGNITQSTSLLKSSTGGIAGVLGKESIISDCVSEVVLTDTSNSFVINIGGITGLNYGIVKKCEAFGTISASSKTYSVNIGGITGENRGIIAGCTNNTELSGRIEKAAANLYIGGISGNNCTGTIERVINRGAVSGEGYLSYPAYIGGITGSNQNGTVATVKNLATVKAERAFVGGITGINIANIANSLLFDCLNTGELQKYDCVFGGIAGANVKAEHFEGASSVTRTLNEAFVKAFGRNDADISLSLSLGDDDGASQSVSPVELINNGTKLLDGEKFWISNSDINAYPDLVVIKDFQTPELLPSHYGDNESIAYCLYEPSGGTVKSVAAVYYQGNRYLGISYFPLSESSELTRIVADSIPQNADRIKFIAFTNKFDDGFTPASVRYAEIIKE